MRASTHDGSTDERRNGPALLRSAGLGQAFAALAKAFATFAPAFAAFGPASAVFALCLLASTAHVAAQVTTHPREMGLAEARSPRPDPSDHRVSLANGVVAYVAEDRTVPLVTVSVFVNAGYAYGEPGAARALVRAYRRGGPAGMAPEDFQGALRRMTADYRVVLGPELVELTLDVPSEDADEAMALLHRMVRDGADVTQADVSAVRAEAGTASPISAEGPRYEGSLDGATRLARAHLLEGSRYAPTPAVAGLGGLDVADAAAFHRRFFVSRNLTLAVGGALASERSRRALQAFSDIRPGDRRRASVVAAPAAPEARVIHAYPADKLQGWLVMGTALPVVARQDEAALEVMNYILGGGHFDTRLFQEARDKRGLTNDDSGFLEPSSNGPGTYTFRTYGRPEVVRLLLHLTLSEIDRIRADGVTEEELFVAKGALADGVFAVRYRDGWTTARSFAEEHARHGDLSWSETYQRRVRGVDAGDALRAARTYLHPERMTIILVGPLEEIRAAPALEGEGPLEQYGRVMVR